jgi:flagellar biosynthesis GTPase FlhF
MIFTPNMGSMLDLESGLFCFLGSQGVGKTYTVTG